MNQDRKEKLLNDLHDDSYCPSCHHGENVEIPNAERVIEEAYRLGADKSDMDADVLISGFSEQDIKKIQCETHTCDYYRHYLAHGPADITHQGYHTAEKNCLQWQERAESYYQNDKPIPVYIESQCRKWEKKVRA